MSKFSVIVPVYNSSKYLKKCLDSVFNQTFRDFDIIVINDGSSDNSQEIIDYYKKEHLNIRSISKKNEGLSEARNDGVTYSNADYIIFLDSDDYWNKDLLLEINKVTPRNDIDVVRFQSNIVNNNYEVNEKLSCVSFEKTDGETAFLNILPSNSIESACLYAYNRQYFINNKFKYAEGKLHEDFGLTILTVLKANAVLSIDYIGYNYYQSNNSITRNNEKNIIRVNDTLFHFDNLIKYAPSNDLIKKIYFSYLANSVISRAELLKGYALRAYIKELKKRNIAKYLLDDTILRRLKKTLIKISIIIYIKIFVRGE